MCHTPRPRRRGCRSAALLAGSLLAGSLLLLLRPLPARAADGPEPVSPGVVRPGVVSPEPPAIPPHPAAESARPGWNAWRYIVVHHSASAGGNAAVFDREHRAKGWDGVAYHFVILNGQGGADGRLQVTRRWWAQKHGAHAGALPPAGAAEERNAYNEFGIGICLVGNFERREPTARQLRTLSQLISRLRARFAIPAENVVGHRHVRSTACPGRKFPWARLFHLCGLPAPHFHSGQATPTLSRCPWCEQLLAAHRPRVEGPRPEPAPDSAPPVPAGAAAPAADVPRDAAIAGGAPPPH